ncbi:MAG: lysophospholipid acyltransferase family protein [Verrucomicrobiales bacterium]|nr:lysophospholipid acyltransferase family protein [Verrucomicrobiales bacterium]
MAKLRIRNAGKYLALLIKGLGATLRLSLDDQAGGLRPDFPAAIWLFWHNRIFGMPLTYRRWFPGVPCTILTSPSGDGQIIADACAAFGLDAARGSSSKPREAVRALRLMEERLRAGSHIAITPDGPRGPRYHLHPGAIKLAQLTGAPIVPIQLDCSHRFTFPTWDRFQLPLPFSSIRVTFHPPLTIPKDLSEDEFEAQRQRVEKVLLAGCEDLPTV